MLQAKSTAQAKPAMIHKSPSVNYAYASVKGTAPHKQTGHAETDKAEATRSIMSSQLTKSNNMRGIKKVSQGLKSSQHNRDRTYTVINACK